MAAEEENQEQTASERYQEESNVPLGQALIPDDDYLTPLEQEMKIDLMNKILNTCVGSAVILYPSIHFGCE